MPDHDSPPKILVCDDQLEIREALRLLLKSHGYLVESYAHPAELLPAALRSPASIILLDMNYTRDTTSGEEGLELIGQLRSHRLTAPILAMTAWGDISLAVSAMQQGASDFLEKPWNNERLLQVIAKWSAVRPRGQQELDTAREVQRNLLPRPSTTSHQFDFACRFLPAREVSGDYYDFFEKAPGHFSFVVADVSGKGVPAALLMSNLQALFRSHAASLGLEPAAILEKVNQYFYQSTAPESFASAFYADFNEVSGELCFVNCGHPAAMLRRADGRMESLEAQATILGAFPFWRASSAQLQLRPGDRLLVFSDGAVEAQSGPEEFGEIRLAELLESTASLSAAHALDQIEEAITAFSGVQLYDDCTLFLLCLP